MRHTRREFLGAAAAAAMMGCSGNGDSGVARRPNIVVLFSDELAPEYLGCYGGEFETPNLDRLAGEGVRFTRAYSAAPMCTPSRYGFLTGRYPGRCTHPEFLADFPEDGPYSIGWNTYVEPSTPTIATRLAAAGYRTGVTGKWHVGMFDADRDVPALEADADPADPAIDELLRRHQEAVLAQVKKDAGFTDAVNVSWSNFDAFRVKKLKQHHFPWINQGAMQFLDEAAAGEEPFFLYAATTAIHGPPHHEMFDQDLRYTPGGRNDGVLDYMPPVDEIRRKLQNAPSWMAHKVAGMVCLDHHVGLVMDKLEDLGVADNTIVLFVADHNIEPGKATVYDKGEIVPMIARWPGRIAGGGVSDSLVQSLDAAPTFLEAAGAPVDEGLDGESLTPVFDDPGAKTRDHVYLESGYTRAVCDGRHKFVAFRPPAEAVEAMKSGETELAPNHLNIPKQAHSQIAIEHHACYFDADQLYDLEADPYEQKNVAGSPEKAEVQEALTARLGEELATFRHPFSLEKDPFLESERYRELAGNTRAIGTDHITWVRRDHGKIVWPPE